MYRPPFDCTAGSVAVLTVRKKLAAVGGIALALAVLGLPPAGVARAADGDAAAGDSQAPANIDPASVVKQFLDSARSASDLDAARVEAAAKAIELAQQDGVELSAALTEGLAALYPEYQQALVLLAEEKFTPAIEALEKLSASSDRYLAADASFFAARGYIAQERYEEALPRLEAIAAAEGPGSLQSGNATFFLAVAQAGLLQRKDAIQTFEKFLASYPQAPERMRVGAFRQLEQLKYIEDGALTDVFHRMEFSRRRLGLGNTDDITRGEQDKIVDMLSKLIKEAEERECNCRGGGGGKSGGENQGGGQGGGGKPDGTGKNGQGGNDQTTDETVRRVYRQGPQSPWSKLRDKDRDPAFSAIKEKFPARYLELVEQYYKSFQDEKE